MKTAICLFAMLRFARSRHLHNRRVAVNRGEEVAAHAVVEAITW